jgi:hypothetical protein
MSLSKKEPKMANTVSSESSLSPGEVAALAEVRNMPHPTLVFRNQH